MRVAVTGASGRLGRAVVRELIEGGHEIVAMDRQTVANAVIEGHARLNERLARKGLPLEPEPVIPDEPPGPIRVEVDLTDYPAVRKALQGVEAVLHLGAYPAFGATHEEQARGFTNNVQTTYIVLEAAAEVGIRRVVYASSIQVYGCTHMNTPTGRGFIPPLYLPVDESHPLRPATPYAASKAAGEDIALHFMRRHPDWTISALRYTAITDRPLGSAADLVRHDRQRMMLLTSLLTRISPAQAACATVMAMHRQGPGFEAFNIANPEPATPWSLDLLQSAYGTLPELRPDLTPGQTLFSVAKARQMLDFQAVPAP